MRDKTQAAMLAAMILGFSYFSDYPFDIKPEPIPDPPPWAKPKYGHGKNGGYRHDTFKSKDQSPRIEKGQPGTEGTRKESEGTMIVPGSRVLVFDHLLFVDDKSTPISVTMKPAIVLRRYGRRCHPALGNWCYPDLVDVQFDHRPNESHCHFTEGVEEIQ